MTEAIESLNFDLGLLGCLVPRILSSFLFWLKTLCLLLKHENFLAELKKQNYKIKIHVLESQRFH